MMRFFLSLFFLSLSFQFALAQDSSTCNCTEQMNFVVSYIEKNNPAFQKIKESKKLLKPYNIEKAKLAAECRNVSDTLKCLDLLKSYVALIKDHHTNIYPVKTNQSSGHATNSVAAKRPYEFRALDDSISYLRVSSFTGSLEKKLNLFYDSISKPMTSKPYLVIDVRDNSGGNDACYVSLIPFIYTDPLKVDVVDVWVSEENLKLYTRNFSDNKELVDKMKAAQLNSFVSVADGETYKLDSVYANPKKIFILQNGGMASSAEDFVLYSRQSKKVTTIGTNTGGYTGYGNVMSASTPGRVFRLQSTTTRYKNGSRYEFTGVPPDVRLDDFNGWEEKVRSLIEKTK